MLTPIVRSAQRIAIRNWAHSSSSLAQLQSDTKCITKNGESSSSSLHNQTPNPGTRSVSCVAAEAKKASTTFPGHLAIHELLDDNLEDVFQECNKIDVYHQPPTNISKKAYLSQWQEAKKMKALKKFEAIEEHLEKTDPDSGKLLAAVKTPLMELERLRASALIDIEACRTLISHIGDIQDPSTAVVIGNPGAGIFSRELVRQGAKQLVLFEPNPEIRAHLQRIHKHDPVIVSDQYLFGSVWKCHNNKHYLNSLLESDKCTRVKIIHSLTNPCQTRNLVENYTSGQIPFDNKKVEIYLVTEKSYGERLANLDSLETQSQVKFASSWRTFMRSEYVCTLSARSFFPKFAPLGFGVKGHTKRDPNVTVVRCTFRSIEVGGRPLNAEERYLFSIFMRHVITSSTAPVAHTLEKWIPGIGIRLIRRGISLFTRFNELTKQEFGCVFAEFIEMAPVDSPVWQVLGGSQIKTTDSTSM